MTVGTYEYNNRLRLAEMSEALMVISNYVDPKELERLKNNIRNWNFYSGFHWEEIEATDRPQITKNYCRPFVDKFVAFEFGKGFTISVPIEEDGDEETPEPITEFLNEVWDVHNSRMKLCVELGQTKAVTGEGWVQVKFEKPEDLNDPFGEFENGRIRLINMSPNVVFPTYDPHDKDKLTKLEIVYPIKEQDKSFILKTPIIKNSVYKAIWTNEEYRVEINGEVIEEGANPYGIIPFVKVLNYPLANRHCGISDLDDIIPLNVELNLKNSDISEIIDYHASPVTVVYGASVGSLERGANKMWGGLPTDAKIENLTMNTDLGASIAYAESTKKAIHEIGNVPVSSLGDTMQISNTSGVALQIMNMPLIERTRVKRLCSTESIILLNKIILLVGIVNGLISKPSDMKLKDFYNNTVSFPDTLPKDKLIELQQLQQEMQMGIESRKGGMKTLGKDIKKTMAEIDEDLKSNPEFYGQSKEQPQLNSGMTNGETPIEQLRKETTGQNGTPKM